MNNNKREEEEKLLMKVYEMCVRTDERLKAITETVKKDFESAREEAREAKNKAETLEKRVEELEKEGVKISSFWKILCIGIPVTISVISILINVFHVTI